MGLDLKKLENVSEKFDGKTIARCPACAAEGGDTKGEHLVLFPDGKFGCVKYEGDAAHRSKIQSLAGDGKRQEHSPVKVTVRPFKVPDPGVVMSLGSFPRFSSNTKRQWLPIEQSLPKQSEPPANEKPEMDFPSTGYSPREVAAPGVLEQAASNIEHAAWVASNSLNALPRWAGATQCAIPHNPLNKKL
jgi:hypothetical protein